MGRQGEPDKNTIDELDEARVFGKIDGEWVALDAVRREGLIRLKTDSKIDEATDEIGDTEARTRILGENNNDNLVEVGAQDLATDISSDDISFLTYIARALDTLSEDELRALQLGVDTGGTVQKIISEQLSTGVSDSDIGQLTYAARALNSKGLDEFVNRVADSSGTQIDPLNQDALQTVSNDELRTRIFGPDNTSTLRQANAEAFDTSLAATDIGLATYISRALEGISQDHIQASIYADDPNNNLVRANINSNGELRTDTSLDAETVEIEGDDDDGNTLQVSVETLSQGIVDPDGLVTYLARALNSIGQDEIVSRIANSTGTQIDPLNQDALQTVSNDELRSRIHDSSGTQVDPATTALEAALKSNDTDEFVARVTGTDGLEIEEEQLDTAIATTDVGLLTYLSRALASQGQDKLQVEQQTPVKLEAPDDDQNNKRINAESLSDGIGSGNGLLTYIARALTSQSEDQLRVDIEGDNVGLATETTLTSADNGIDLINDALESQSNDQLRTRVHDSTGAQIDPAVGTDYLDSQATGHDLISSGDLTIGPGAVERGTAVTIAATSTDNNTFSVSVSWEDGSGNVFQSESASDIGLDTITEDYARLVRKAPQVSITVTDESGAAQNNVNIHADTER